MVLANNSDHFQWLNGKLLLPGEEIYVADPPGQEILQNATPDHVPADVPDEPAQDKKRK